MLEKLMVSPLHWAALQAAHESLISRETGADVPSSGLLFCITAQD
jgi:hypothetical protein